MRCGLQWSPFIIRGEVVEPAVGLPDASIQGNHHGDREMLPGSGRKMLPWILKYLQHRHLQAYSFGLEG